MSENPKPSQASSRLTGRAIGPKVEGATVRGPEVRGPQMSLLETLTCQREDAQQMTIWDRFSSSKDPDKIIVPRHTLAHFRRKFLREMDQNAEAAEVLQHIMVGWPVLNSGSGHTECRTFPDCLHTGCALALSHIRMAARQLLQMRSPLSAELRRYAEIVVAGELKPKMRLLARTLRTAMGGEE